jgi:peptide/nickel transport system substrate-binding protein
MKFGTFFTWFKKQTHSILPKSHLDHKLIGSINTKTVPSLTQLKYVGHFLAPQEKKILAGLGGIALVAALALGGIFVGTHFTAVAKDGGDYSEAMVGQPKFVNPIYASVSDIDSDLSFLTYTGLFHYTNGQTLTPDLAEKYTLSDDKKIYTVTLKKNISWSDGEPFKADDVLYTFETIQNPEASSPLLPAFQGVQVEKVDDATIRFTLKEPFAPFLNSLTVGIIPEHIWSDIPALNLKLAPTNLKPVGTGPWKFSKLIKDDSGSEMARVMFHAMLCFMLAA